MNITEKTLCTLEFDKIRRMLADVTPTEGAKELARMLTPTDREAQILSAQRRTTDAKRLSDEKGMPPFGDAPDLCEICERADKGAVLTPRELLCVASVLRSARLMRDYIRSNRTFDTVLDEVFDRLLPNHGLEDTITRAIISEDMIADEASAALCDVRRRIRAANVRIRETLRTYVSGAHAKYLQENIVTQRNGRYVVPVRAECKNDVKGLIHDTSASGATIFVEPMAVVEANNELRMLEAKEEHEIERVLAALSAQVSGFSSALLLNRENIVELAFCFGCAELSRKMNAVCPELSKSRECVLLRARHPLIDPATVVPIGVSLGGDYDTLIITGPNTGGKTVTLKTLGLFALMAQAGLHVPADEGTRLCMFEKILVDLGDEQSIEQSLSTFSSHMVTIVDIVKERNDRSLVLFDELGAGTDPVEGAALAVAVIEDVRSAGALCAATTHYTELKAYALDTEGVCNASCEFDVETLRPTYKLVIGTPGKSNAFAISEKLGLPAHIVARADSYVSAENKHFENVIGELEASRVALDKQLEEARASREEYESFRRTSEAAWQKRLDDAERRVEEAKKKAQGIVESAKASGEYIMEQMGRLKRARDSERLGEELEAARRAVREHLRQNEDRYNPVETRERDENYVLPRALRRGDEVRIVSLGKIATVTDAAVKSGRVEVQAGIIRTRVPLTDLVLIVEDKQTSAQKATAPLRMTVSRDFRDEIDLRGLTGDEAWSKVDKYFDEATVAGFTTVRLIHGKGTGALKAALWSYLKKDRRIKSFRIGQYGEGDGGVTVVELR